jgi:FkbM family methyltransferase
MITATQRSRFAFLFAISLYFNVFFATKFWRANGHFLDGSRCDEGTKISIETLPTTISRRGIDLLDGSRCDEGTKISIETLPTTMLRRGIDLFDSRRGLEEVLSRSAPPVWVNIAGKSFCILSHELDDSIPRLQSEFGLEDTMYGAKSLDINSQGTVVDIGANLGAFSIFVASVAINLQVVSFEPTPTTYFYFLCNLHLNKINVLQSSDWGDEMKPGVLALHGAAGSRSGFISVSWSPEATQNAAVGTTEPSTQDWLTKEVTQFDVKDFVDGRKVNILKMDCEGCEFSVMPHLQEELLDRTKIVNFVGEFHLSLLDKNTETNAKKPSDTSISKSLNVLEKRGCAKAWRFEC